MPRNRQLLLLGVLVVALVVVGAYQYRHWPSASTAVIAAPTAGSPRARRAQGASVTVPTVRLDALTAARDEPKPPPAERNVFQFRAAAPPPPPPMLPGQAGSATAQAANMAPPPPPPPAPIPLKFIGIVQAPSQKLAVLSDATTHDVFYGREGDIVDGRFRILRIGVESIEMAYADGRGRQSIRLSGQ
jgi:hypothetical protein